jgi:hypothetical protein
MQSHTLTSLLLVGFVVATIAQDGEVVSSAALGAVGVVAPPRQLRGTSVLARLKFEAIYQFYKLSALTLVVAAAGTHAQAAAFN